MSEQTNPVDQDAAAAKKRSEDELKARKKERFQKSFKKFKEAGCDDDDAMSKAIDEMDSEDSADKDDVVKAIQDLGDAIANPALAKPFFSKEQHDELVKSLDGTALQQHKATQTEIYETRKVLRGYADATLALVKAVHNMGVELQKAISGLQVPAADMSKSVKTDEVPEHLANPKAAEAAKGGAVTLQTPAEQAASTTPKVTSDDFIAKANAWAEQNPRDPMTKALAGAIGEVISGGSLQKHIDAFGKTIGLS